MKSNFFGRLRFIALAALALSSLMLQQAAHAQNTQFSSVQGPAVAVFNGVVFMAWTGRNADHTIYLSYWNGSNWSSLYQLGNNTSLASAGPALAVYNNKLWIAWTGGGNNINLESSTDGINFSNHIEPWAGTPHFTARGSLALASTGTSLYIAWGGQDTANTVYYAHTNTGGEIFGAATPAVYGQGTYGSLYSPALGSVAGGMELATVLGPVGQPNALFGQGLVAPNFLGDVPGPNPSDSGPGMGSQGNNLYIAYPAESPSYAAINVATFVYSPDQGGQVIWLNTVPTTQTCIGNPAIVSYLGHMYLAWTGTDSGHHVNWMLWQ